MGVSIGAAGVSHNSPPGERKKAYGLSPNFSALLKGPINFNVKDTIIWGPGVT
jgi:hypothetical protein